VLHTKYWPQVFVALSRFNIETLEFFKESIIEWLKLLIDKSNNSNYVNKSLKILSESYWINHSVISTVNNVSTQVKESFTYQEKKDRLCDLIELNMDSIPLEDNEFEPISINELLKIHKIHKWKKIKCTNLDLINILTDIYNERPDFLSKNFIVKKKGFSVSKELLEFIQDYVSLRDNDNLRNNSFAELRSLSVEYGIPESDLLDIIIFNQLFTRSIKILPFTWTKSSTFTLDNQLIVEYMQRIGKIKNDEI
jgi:hypothetical protein